MTREEKHALIEKEILGLSDLCEGPGNCEYDAYSLPHWYYCESCGGGSETTSFSNPHRRVPKDYSCSLDLCASAEAKIADKGWKFRLLYRQELVRLWEKDGSIMHDSLWWIMVAPASARVDAMVNFIGGWEK